MPLFQGITLLAKQLFAEIVRLGKPAGTPGPSSTMQAIYGSPELVVLGIAGDLALQVDGPAIWMKTGSRTIVTSDGWVQVAIPITAIIEALAFSRQYMAFSGSSLDTVVGSIDFYFRFSANLDATAIPSDNNNISDSIISETDIGPGIAAQRLAVRAGSVSGLVMRSSSTLDLVQPFVDVADDTGPFVRTFLSAITPMPADTNVRFDAIAIPYPVNSRYRAGYRTTTGAAFSYDMQVELEITTPVSATTA
jgi:hypothetical protein